MLNVRLRKIGLPALPLWLVPREEDFPIDNDWNGRPDDGEYNCLHHRRIHRLREFPT